MSAVLNTPITHLYRQSISCILSTVLLGNTLYAGGIVVDNSAREIGVRYSIFTF
jgi:hypothetical protein